MGGLKEMFVMLFLATICVIKTNGASDWSADQFPERWNTYAKNTIEDMLKRKANGNIAKNNILFLGDGMGVTTVTAGRIRKGQQQNRNGEEEITNIDKFPYTALSKTYNIDAQTADSAGTATAFLTGVKTRIGMVGVDGRAIASDCKSSLNTKLDSILKWAQQAGKSVGIVTTTRVTHATPSAAYSNVPNRNWEAYDEANFFQNHYQDGCRDIAWQLVNENSNINVVFGGGRRKFLRRTDRDYKTPSLFGDRMDGRNLIEDWTAKMTLENKRFKFTWNITDFEELKPGEYDHILGLQSYDHMQYETDRNPLEEPSLARMTEKAIQLLSTNPKGYFLLVEGGKIDHAHHESNAKRALDDFVAFDEAVGRGRSLTSEIDTQIVVTADHSHVFTFGGYAERGNSLLGLVRSPFNSDFDSNGLRFTSILYGNGPGGLNGPRQQLTASQAENNDYKQESAVRLGSETHGGEDVSIYSSGPMSFLFSGTVEQNFITHAMAYASCIGPYNETLYPKCKTERGALVEKNGTYKTQFSLALIVLQGVFYLFFSSF